MRNLDIQFPRLASGQPGLAIFGRNNRMLLMAWMNKGAYSLGTSRTRISLSAGRVWIVVAW